MILLTGATGYIGSHIWVALLNENRSVIGFDNLSNSNLEVLTSIKKISGKQPIFVRGDIRDTALLSDLFTNNAITHVIHLAGLKDVQESMLRKHEYHDVNVCGFEALLQAMRVHGCNKVVFSSSAAVYGASALSPIPEYAELSPSNYYGETKLAGERLLEDELNKEPSIFSVSLRYFNVAGRHSSGLLTGDLSERSHSLFSEINKVLSGEREALSIFGNDWGTEDGTCIRDYLHVEDLVQGHIDSLSLLDKDQNLYVFNLGLGLGRSVSQVISTCEEIVGRSIPKKFVDRRLGDVGVSFAAISQAQQKINWEPKKVLIDICRDSIGKK